MKNNKEYGGFIPFDLPEGKGEYFSDFSRYTIKVNSARTGIMLAVKDIQADKVFMPLYTCPSVKKTVEELGSEVVYYRLNDKMIPVIDEFSSKDVLIWTNYFGIISEKQINFLIEKFKNIIFDNAQAFFKLPIMRKNIYNVYSCRKFIGVPDGGYLIAQNMEKVDLKQDISHNKMGFIFKQLEMGVNNSYQEYLENESFLDDNYLGMSVLTEKILNAVDYTGIKDVRARNYMALHNMLRNINNISIDLELDGNVPMVYPLLVKSESLREYLISNNIYVPTWWKHLRNVPLNDDAMEYQLSRYLLPLPVDQRYDEEDMKFISKVVKKRLKSKGEL